MILVKVVQVLVLAAQVDAIPNVLEIVILAKTVKQVVHLVMLVLQIVLVAVKQSVIHALVVMAA